MTRRDVLRLLGVTAAALAADPERRLLQLAMRHPGTKGQPSAKIARSFIDGMIASLEQAGFVEHAQLVRAGDDPKQDQAPPASPIVQA